MVSYRNMWFERGWCDPPQCGHMIFQPVIAKSYSSKSTAKLTAFLHAVKESADSAFIFLRSISKLLLSVSILFICFIEPLHQKLRMEFGIVGLHPQFLGGTTKWLRVMWNLAIMEKNNINTCLPWPETVCIPLKAAACSFFSSFCAG